MRQLLVVVAVLAALGLAARFTPPQQQILPLDFSKDFPEHREHHEQLLHNLGQKALRSYPGDVIRMWWVGPNPQQLLVVEPTGIWEVTYETDGYKPRVVEHSGKRLDITAERWTEIEESVFRPEMWEMTPDPGLGPFTVGGRTWILEMKQGERYRCMEKIDPLPRAFGEAIMTLTALQIPSVQPKLQAELTEKRVGNVTCCIGLPARVPEGWVERMQTQEHLPSCEFYSWSLKRAGATAGFADAGLTPGRRR